MSSRPPAAAPSNPRPPVPMNHPPMNRAAMVVPRMPMVQAVPVGMQGVGMVRNFPPGLVPPPSGGSGGASQPPRPGQHPVMTQPTPFYHLPGSMPMNAMFPCMPMPASMTGAMTGATIPVPNMKAGNGQPIGQPLKVPLA